ncbi:NIN-like protein [Artemisia annua]|uniref:NIN-like protein n=1 Tax=Artemisia annua TaxID=35608 RepID=A0A2U1LT55_ARTAN|nr:NIN-like protein [Artemisia annua]
MSQYPPKLVVYEKEGDSAQSTINNGGFMLTAENIHDPHNQKKLRDKIGTALKLVSIREQHVLVQFWSSHVVGKDQLLTNINQPYGLGANDDEALLSYRKNSECNVPVADNHLNPPARVFKKRLPEWTSDISNYSPKDFPQKEYAIQCNFHGYLALPVFDSTTEGLCVGVLEFLASSKYMSYDYEVKQVHKALKEQNLTCQQAFDHPALNVPNYHKQNEWNKIHCILKELCDIHNLPLAQTWEAVSPSSNFASHDKIIHKTCSSFDTKCIGKVCMSTASQALHVKELSLWKFMEECEKRHLEKSKGVVGRALASKDLVWYCRDVTKLNEDEYPLAILARTYKLTGCFAFFLHGVEGNAEYVLEFFLRSGMEDDRVIKDVVQTLKKKIDASSGLELGDTSSIQEVGPPSDLSDISN